MSTRNDEDKSAFISNAVEAGIRIGILLFLASWCFDIIRPFMIMVIWGVIIAVASYPVYVRLCRYLSGRAGLAAVLYTVLLLSVLLVPTVMLSETALESTTDLAAQLRSGELHIPPPPESVKEWPLVGSRLSEAWLLASENISAALNQVKPQLKSAGLWLVGAVKSAGAGLLQFLVAIILSGIFLKSAESGKVFAKRFAERLVGSSGAQYAELTGSLIQSVTQGILGVAIIQSLMAGAGFLVMGVPAAGFWAFLCLLLAVIQIGPAVILVGVAVYVFDTADLLPAVLYIVWSVAVALIDNFLKPILLGRGVDVPMAVVFVGAIGGFLSMGIIGLFLGAVVLALSHSLFLVWLNSDDSEAPV